MLELEIYIIQKKKQRQTDLLNKELPEKNIFIYLKIKRK
jgi:hypothetical protein